MNTPAITPSTTAPAAVGAHVQNAADPRKARSASRAAGLSPDPMQQVLPLAAAKPPANLDDLARHLLGILTDYAAGHGNAIKRREVLAMIHRAAAERWTDAQLRMAKEELLEAGHAVGSGPAGWWLIADWQEAADAANFLIQRRDDLARKVRLVYANARRRLGPPPSEFNAQQEIFS